MFTYWLIRHFDPDLLIWKKLASVWVAGFWGAVGSIVTILPLLINMDNIWWLGPLIVFMAASFAIARFIKQPGAV